ncbi:hypothetical protein FE784_16350 [Paenibacillus hemerocallicola]|uniref:Uncharacterized protein n=1 Tax=Paenibacillus hemerocallicola TaxID=1172614 RepID=A0A5C4T7Y4_9BACL|nr:hypothetical protein [Paenibacillus hemerocallicola]TNJ65168.1 hypothetical protein FE784_16350 [Paenibacillus hemerocallicola]
MDAAMHLASFERMIRSQDRLREFVDRTTTAFFRMEQYAERAAEALASLAAIEFGPETQVPDNGLTEALNHLATNVAEQALSIDSLTSSVSSLASHLGLMALKVDDIKTEENEKEKFSTFDRVIAMLSLLAALPGAYSDSKNLIPELKKIKDIFKRRRNLPDGNDSGSNRSTKDELAREATSATQTEEVLHEERRKQTKPNTPRADDPSKLDELAEKAASATQTKEALKEERGKQTKPNTPKADDPSKLDEQVEKTASSTQANEALKEERGKQLKPNTPKANNRSAKDELAGQASSATQTDRTLKEERGEQLKPNIPKADDRSAKDELAGQATSATQAERALKEERGEQLKPNIPKADDRSTKDELAGQASSATQTDRALKEERGEQLKPSAPKADYRSTKDELAELASSATQANGTMSEERGRQLEPNSPKVDDRGTKDELAKEAASASQTDGALKEERGERLNSNAPKFDGRSAGDEQTKRTESTTRVNPDHDTSGMKSRPGRYFPPPHMGFMSNTMGNGLSLLKSIGKTTALTSVLSGAMNIATAENKQTAIVESVIGAGGAAIGSIFGSMLLPGAGTVAGGMAGAWLGEKAGKFFGNMWFGSKDDESKKKVEQVNAQALSNAAEFLEPRGQNNARLLTSLPILNSEMQLYPQNAWPSQVFDSTGGLGTATVDPKVTASTPTYNISVEGVQIVMPKEEIDEESLARRIGWEIVSKMKASMENQVVTR